LHVVEDRLDQRRIAAISLAARDRRHDLVA